MYIHIYYLLVTTVWKPFCRSECFFFSREKYSNTCTASSWSSYLFLPPFTTVPPARVFKRKEPKQVEEKKKKEPSIVIVRPSNLATDARSLPTTYTTYVLVLLLHIHTPRSRLLFLWRRVRTKLDGRDSREKKDRTANCREKSQEMKKVKEKRLSAGLLTDWLAN